jgi:aminotransferase
VGYDGANEALITVGGRKPLICACAVLLNDGDEVLVHEPSFVCTALTMMSNGVSVPIVPRRRHLPPKSVASKRLSHRRRRHSSSLPNNPTGAILERKDLEGIAEMSCAERYSCYCR